jgi:hypothetical protein
MASKNDMSAIKALLESLHAKVDQLSAEVQELRSGSIAVAVEDAVKAEVAESPAAEEAEDTSVSEARDAENPAWIVVVDFVAAALLKNDEACWSELERLTHSGALLAPRSLDHLKAFSWKKLRVNARRYFKKRGDIKAARIEPEAINESTQLVKVFVAHGKGSSSPLTVARDSQADGEWRVQTCSL